MLLKTVVNDSPLKLTCYNTSTGCGSTVPSTCTQTSEGTDYPWQVSSVIGPEAQDMSSLDNLPSQRPLHAWKGIAISQRTDQEVSAQQDAWNLVVQLHISVDRWPSPHHQYIQVHGRFPGGHGGSKSRHASEYPELCERTGTERPSSCTTASLHLYCTALQH